MKKLIFTILPILMLLGGCIVNDIPYPRIQAGFTYMSAIGESKAAEIDSANRIVTLFFPEEANIYEVRIDTFAMTPNTVIESGDLSAPIDLSSTCYLTLRMYQDYLWKVVASQDIERYFTIEGQIGASTIDVPGKRVLATVNDRVKLESLFVESCKLGASSATMTPDISGKKVDFSHPVVINVENYGHIERWTIYVEQTEATVVTASVDGWTKVAWVYGEAQAGKQNTVQYRIKGDTEWLTVPDSWLTHNGGNFCARLVGLTPQTEYEARAVSGEEYGETLTFTTGSDTQLPNGNFDEWWLNGKIWCPWPEGGEQFWDTGNKGATTLGPSNSIPTDDTVDGHGRAACLQTKFIGIGMLGKLAAGNIFVGSYVRTDGTNGVLSFGKPFTERPTKLKGYWKYKTAPISSTTSGYEDLKGRPDTASVWVALIDTPEPFEIRTNPKNQQLFDPNGSYVVAYGRVQTGDDIDAYAPFEVEFVYTSTNRVPKYIITAASASKYGDFFTGGNGAVLYVDNFVLEYDY